MKKVLLYIIIFASICYLTNYSIDYTIGKQLQNQSPYYLSFASIGANSLESHLDCWAKLKSTSSNEDMEAYLLDILECMGISVIKEKMLWQQNDSGKTLYYEIKMESENYYIAIENNNHDEATYLIVSVDSQKNKELNYLENKLNRLIGPKWTYYYRYTGKLDYIIDKSSQKKLMNIISHNLQCTGVTEFDDNSSLSCTGYSPLVNKYCAPVTVEKSKYNVQIAVQIDEKQGNTNIIIGSPLILGNY